MRIREATIRDAESIAALHAASWQSTYARVLQKSYLSYNVPIERRTLWLKRLSEASSNQRVLLGEISEEVVGFACVFIDHDPKLGSYLENLHVTSDAQGVGVGTQLMQKVASICSLQAKSSKMFLSVNQDNVRAQDFYLRLGATNAAEAVWNAPDGSAVPTYRFEWSSVSSLATNGG